MHSYSITIAWNSTTVHGLLYTYVCRGGGRFKNLWATTNRLFISISASVLFSISAKSGGPCPSGPLLPAPPHVLHGRVTTNARSKAHTIREIWREWVVMSRGLVIVSLICMPLIQELYVLHTTTTYIVCSTLEAKKPLIGLCTTAHYFSECYVSRLYRRSGGVSLYYKESMNDGDYEQPILTDSLWFGIVLEDLHLFIDWPLL